MLPGAVVTLSAEDRGVSRVVTTDDTGVYAIEELPPGLYALKVELSGFATVVREGVDARAGMKLGLDVAMKIGAIGEVVTVKSETPLLDLFSATTTVNISGRLQRSVPLSYRRDWADFFLLTPGVLGPDIAGLSAFSLHGSSPSSHVLHVDGADMGSASSNAVGLIKLSPEAVDDVQVKTAGLDASAPLGLGAVVNLTTTSGTNALRGVGAVLFQPEAWNSNNTPGGTSSTQRLVQPELAIGGPLQRGRWWGFTSYRRTQRILGLSRTPQQLADLSAVEPSFRPFNNEARGNTAFGKVTGQISKTHQLTGFIQNDRFPMDANLASYVRPLVRNEYGGIGSTVRISSLWTSSTTSRVAMSYNDKGSDLLTAFDDRPAQIVYRNTVTVGGRLVGSGDLAVTGNGTRAFDDDAQKTTISAEVAHFRQGWLGSHDLQAGLYFQPWLRQRRTSVLPNEGFVLEEQVLRDPSQPSAGSAPFHRQIYDADRIPVAYIDSHDYAIFVQDAWRPTTRLTVSAGLRIDWIRQTDVLFDVRTQNSTDLGPRIGLNYAVTANGHNSLRASWVRVHDNAFATSVAAGSTTSDVTDYYDTNLDGIFETALVTPGSSAVARDRVFDTDAWHQPYVNETTVGYRRQLPGLVSVDVGWIRREYRDRSAGIETNGIYDGGTFSGYKNESQNQIYLVANNRWNWPVYSALEIQVAKQTSRVQLLASYTRQWRHLAGTWQPNDPASFIQPDAFPNDRGIGGTRGVPGGSTDANSLSGSQATSSSNGQWQDHAARIGISYRAPWDVLLAGSYVFQSGVWSGPIVTRLSAPDPAFGAAMTRLSNGRVASNPLATDIRFAGETRADPQRTLPGLHVVNLRLGRETRFGRYRIEGAVDVFNLTNRGADQWFVSGANQAFNSSFGRAENRQLPRSFQASVRFAF